MLLFYSNHMKQPFSASMEGRKLEQTKGQLIWKCSSGVFKLPKKPTKNFLRISALASKKWLNIKKKVENYLIRDFSLFGLLLEARTKNNYCSLVQMMTPKGYFEINNFRQLNSDEATQL